MFLVVLILASMAFLFAEWSIVGTYSISGKASGLTTDGTYLYYGIYGANGGRVYRFNPATQQETLLFDNTAINDSYGMCFDGQYLWITDHGTPTAVPAYALQLDFNGNQISQFNLPDHYMSGIEYDGGDFWVMTYYPDPGIVYKVDNSGAVLQQFVPPHAQPWDICKEGSNLWIVDYNAYLVEKVSLTGELLESHPSEQQRPSGIAFDGTYLWYVAGGLTGQSTLYKVDLGGSGTPEIEVSPSSYVFPNVVLGEESSTDFTLTNTGTATLDIDSITFDSAAFSSSFVPSQSLEPSETMLLSVTFAPLEASLHEGTMTIVSNDPFQTNLEIPLSGVGVYGASHIEVSPTALNYGEVRINADTGRFFTILNQGTQDLQISGISFSNDDFYIDGSHNFPITLSPLQEYSLRIWFSPSTAAQIFSSATIHSNDSSNPNCEIELSGSGFAYNLSMGELLWQFQILPGSTNNIRAIKAIDDIWGNGLQDVIVCGQDRHVRALNGNSHETADIIWEQYIPQGSVPYAKSLVICEDLDGDGIKDIVVGTGDSDRSIHSFSGKSGNPLWTFQTNVYGFGGTVYQVDGAKDYNNDGIPDILAAMGDDAQDLGPKRIFLINGATGTLIWERYTLGPAFSVISVADFTGDGVPDVLAGASNESESQAWVHGINGSTGEIVWSIQPGGSSVWALAQIDDITGDGIADVMIGCFLGGGNFFALDATNGNTIWNGSTGSSMIVQLEVVEDVDADGYRDIAIGHATANTTMVSGHTGSVIWSQSTADNAWYMANGGDLNGDSINDLFVGTMFNNNAAYFMDGATGQILHTIFPGTPMDAMGAINDVTADNSREMITGGRNGWVRCYSGGPVTLPTPGVISGNVSIAQGPGVVTDVIVSVGDFDTSPDAQGNHQLSLEPGTYSVAASLLGYQSQSISQVSVQAGLETSNVDFVLQMIPLNPPIELQIDEFTADFSWEVPASSEAYYPQSYQVFLDGVQVGETDELSWVFEDLQVQNNYVAGVKAIYATGISELATLQFTYLGTANDDLTAPITKLYGNFPNPFNPSTSFSFSLAKKQRIQVDIYNVKGQRVRRLSADFEAGKHQLSWNAVDENQKALASGVYYYTFRAGEYISQGRMVLMK